MQRQIPKLYAFVFLMISSYSCTKESLSTRDITSINLVDKAVYIDSMTVQNLQIGHDSISFDIKAYGNGIDQVEFLPWLKEGEGQASARGIHVVLDRLLPNTTYEVVIEAATKQTYNLLNKIEVLLTTTNSLNQTSYLYNHRKFYRPGGHLRNSDGTFVFVSFLDKPRGIYDEDQEGMNLLEVNLFKTDASGKEEWNLVKTDIHTKEWYNNKAKILSFSNGDLLLMAGSEIQRLTANGELVWKYYVNESQESNNFFDVKILGDESVFAVGSTYKGAERAQILHLSSEGKLLKTKRFDELREELANFQQIIATSTSDFYVIGTSVGGYRIVLAKINGYDVEWTKELSNDGFRTGLSMIAADNHLFVSSYTRMLSSSFMKVGLDGNIIKEQFVNKIYARGLALGHNGHLYTIGANFDVFEDGYARLLTFNADLEVENDLLFGKEYGKAVGYDILSLDTKKVSVYGYGAYIHWHSITQLN